MTPRLDAQKASALLVLFLLSGATSLVYQVLWVRQLSLVLGSTLYAISAVVSAFMAGLALGSVVLGSRVDRSSSPLRVYALLEGGIGVCGLAIPWAIDALGRSSMASGGAIFALGFLLLLVPTALMGGTLPALGRYVAGFPGSRGRLVGALYALNTTGAIVGAALAGFVCIRVLGLRGTTLVVAAGNFVICAAALVLARLWPASPTAPVTVPRTVSQHETQLLRPVTIAYFVNGLVGLGLEVLWTRAVLLFSGNSIYAFTVILTTFLLGIALGSIWMSARVQRVQHAPALLGGLQCLIALIAGLTPLLLAQFGVPLFQAAQNRAAPLGLGAQALSAYVVSGLFMLPATLLMGASFPLVARIVADHTGEVGHAVGRMYALNTVGAVLGSGLAAIVAVPAIGIQRSILLFAVFSAAAGTYLARRAGAVGWTRTGIGTLAILALALVAAPNQFRGMLEKMLRVRLSFYEEGVEATVGVYDSRKAARPVLLINSAALDDHGVVHKMLSHLPALLHADPKRALVFGFGVGISSESLASHDLEVNDCVEISPEVMNAAPQFAKLNGNIASRGDPRFRLHVADGRRFLLSRPERYDIIVLDANSGKLRNAGVGKLYTREFFELCRDRLSPNGMVTAYVSPNSTLREFKMIVRTFLEVFPHTTLWVDPLYGEACVLLGGTEPLAIDVDRYLERIARPRVQTDLASFRMQQPGVLLSSFVMGEAQAREFARDGEINTDDRPLMEFYPLDMDPFEIDDHPLSQAGLPLYEESVLPSLRGAADAESRALQDFVAAEERAFPSMWRHWEALRSRRSAEALEWLQLASSLHPSASYLQALLGRDRGAEAGPAQATLVRAEGALVAGGAAAAVQALAGIPALTPSDYARALVLVHALRGAGATDARVDALEAEALEGSGDHAGAWLAYQDILRQRDEPNVQRRARASALELALRAWAHREAHGAAASRSPVLASRLGRGTVPASAVPDVDGATAEPWLELSDQYAASGRPLLAYQAARAARIREPRNPKAYAAVEATAQRLGAEQVVRLARDQASRFGGTR